MNKIVYRDPLFVKNHIVYVKSYTLTILQSILIEKYQIP